MKDFFPLQFLREDHRFASLQERIGIIEVGHPDVVNGFNDFFGTDGNSVCRQFIQLAFDRRIRFQVLKIQVKGQVFPVIDGGFHPEKRSAR